ncbi:hypothetical protein LIER_06234 [Lithospermum erythrorhizon]|uniref:Uncharacterized protein n=1 Tax=Lithospermum erythrorhizon TaxID=34254 RepID=A0AAV3P4R8_LITER
MAPKRSLSYALCPRHVEFRFSVNEATNCEEGCMFIRSGTQVLKFDHDDFFFEDFGLINVGFCDLEVKTWPSDMGVEVSDMLVDLNQQPDFTPNHRSGTTYLGHFSPDDKFLLKVIRSVIRPTNNSCMELSHIKTTVLYSIKHHLRINLSVLIMAQIHSAVHRCMVSYYPYGLVVSYIMMKWNILRVPQNTPRMSLGVIGLSTVKKTGFQIENGILVPKTVEPASTSEGVAKCPRTGNVEAAGTSRGAENVVTENVVGGEGVEEVGHDEGIQIPQWLDDFTFDDIPVGASGIAHPSIEAQLAEIRHQQIELRQEQSGRSKKNWTDHIK